MMGFDPMQMKYIRLAHERGLGQGDPANIEIAGDDVSNESWGFSVGHNLVSRVGHVCWFGPLRHIQRLFFHTPLVHVFVAGSECYHDWYRWPVRDSVVFRHWLAETQWGKLFETYSKGFPGPGAEENQPVGAGRV